jgi:hypothetical protein
MMTYDKPKKRIPDWAVLAGNLALFAAYTIWCVSNNEDGWFVIGLWQAGICTLLALLQRRWVWFLAALLIVIIGFATCVNTFHLDTK